ncbi:hypothetical protein HK103_004185 [Boothiomyces macroporosus]|uniref:Cyclin N-terminal domain-containing protein n=1 Tax=Boothiomyces macroporosus TaxID=261099 RepID=A0AAD5UJI0_9FUNG|nr:hypothetical protein HK103_004185 [Boothiomyces macroporosus]
MAMDARSDNFARERRLHFQPSVDPAVRWWLIDWLMDVCVENQIGRDTFHGAIQYLDILLCIRSFDGVFYQFAAATALMVAQKTHNNFVNALHPTCVDFLKGAFQFATLVDKRDPQRLPGAEPMPHGLFDGYRKERCKTFFHPKFNEATYELNHEMSLNIFYLSTGYQLEELRECLHLVSQYQISSIHRILELPNIANMILDNSAKETQINIQDHQLPIDMEFSEFANLINIGKPPSSKPSR